MCVKYLVGFAVTCGLVVAGLDLAQRAKSADGGLSVRDYLASDAPGLGLLYESVFADAKSCLPETSSDWTRQALKPADDSLI